MIITLCGSARFERHFKEWNERLSLCGHLVFSISVYPSDKLGQKDWYTTDQKTILDRVHRGKIEASDAVLILNVGRYIGKSTEEELKFASYHQKLIYALDYISQPERHGSTIFPVEQLPRLNTQDRML